MNYTIWLLLLVGAVGLRVGFINDLVRGWNLHLNIYIHELRNNPNIEQMTIDYMEKYKLNKYKYYLRLDIWSINKIINDPFLIQEIMSRIKK